MLFCIKYQNGNDHGRMLSHKWICVFKTYDILENIMIFIVVYNIDAICNTYVSAHVVLHYINVAIKSRKKWQNT